MFTRMTGFAALMMVGLAGSAMAADPPETTVQFDLQWLSPPQVTPAGGQAMARQTPEYTRLQGAANLGGSFTWPLRYAVEVQRYPILTLRYRARDLSVGPTYANRIMDVQLVDSGGRMNSLTVINYEDLVQDGTVHEIRKDLSQVPADAFIDQMRFNFQGATAGGRLDVYSITLDRGPNSPEPMKFEQRPVEFVVKDAAGNAVPDAEVHLGLLERSNWVALGSTDAAGRVALMTLAQVRPDGTIDPVEAVVEHEGNLPQYVAPIKLPASGPVEVKLSPMPQAQAQPQVVPPAPAQPVTQAEPVYYENPVYVPYPVYTYGYAYSYSTPGYWWVPTYCVRTRPIAWCDHDDRWREHHGDHGDVRWYDHPRPVTPPSRNGPPPIKITPPQRMDHGPGPERADDGWTRNRPTPNLGHDRDAGPVVTPSPWHQNPPDAVNRDRDNRARPVLANEPVIGSAPGKISTPPRAQDGEGRNGGRDTRGDAMSAPHRVDSESTRSITPQRPAPAPAPVAINVPDRPDRNEPPKARPDPVSAPDLRDPPARTRVQRDDQNRDDQPAPRVEPPSRTTRSDPPARVQRGNDDDQRRQSQRDDVAQHVAAEPSRTQGQHDSVQRDTAGRDQSVRRDDTRRVAPAPVPAPAPPPTVARDDAGRRTGAQADGSTTDQDSGNAGAGRPARR